MTRKTRWRRAARSVLGCLLAAVLLACSGSGAPPATLTAPPPASTAVPPSPTPLPPAPTPAPPARPDASPFSEALRLSSLRYLEQIAALRNTPVRADVEMFSLSREQARAYYTPPEPPVSAPGGGPPAPATPRIDLKQEVYEILGLVPEQKPPAEGERPSTPSLQQSQVDNLIALITGFYSPELKALYVLETINGGINGPLARSTIVHELTHALQYQYADLDAIAARRANNWDATTALLDVIEGEAVYTETQLLGFSTRSTYRQPVCFAIPAAQRAGTPYVVERELDTWYEDGFCFIRAVTKDRTLDTVFANLPVTTEQILHPEKYLAGEGALPVSLPDLRANLGTGWRKAGSGAFGEFMAQNILLAGLPDDRPRVQAAAAGWGGDAWSLYVNGDARALQASVTWDTPEDAAEFWQTLLRALAARGAARAGPGAGAFELTVNGVTWRAKLDGATTSLLLANDPSVTLTP